MTANNDAESINEQARRAHTLPALGKTYMSYLNAFNFLSKKMNATPAEIAAWVLAGPNDGGLAAYLNANELEIPPRFFFNEQMDENYLAPLMDCWFVEDDIYNFHPADRYITGKELIKRWREQPGIKMKSFVKAMFKQSRLMDIHPIMGGTQWSNGDQYPAKKTALFVLSQIESIEAEARSHSRTQESTVDSDENGYYEKYGANPSDEIYPKWQMPLDQMAEELKQKDPLKRYPTKNKAAKELAQKLEVDVENIKRRTRKTWKN